MARWDKKEKQWPQVTPGVLPRVCSMGISIWDPIYAERFHASCDHEFMAWFKNGCFWVTEDSLRLTRAWAQDFDRGLAEFSVFKPRA